MYAHRLLGEAVHIVIFCALVPGTMWGIASAAAAGSGRAEPRFQGSTVHVTGPRGPYASRPSKITFSTGSDFAAYVDHLSWVDWGKPVAYASGIVHTRNWQQHGYIATPGGVILDQLISCEGRSYYTYAELFAPAGFAQDSQNTYFGQNARALTRCT
jgi:hypothetical protein